MFWHDNKLSKHSFFYRFIGISEHNFYDSPSFLLFLWHDAGDGYTVAEASRINEILSNIIRSCLNFINFNLYGLFRRFFRYSSVT